MLNKGGYIFVCKLKASISLLIKSIYMKPLLILFLAFTVSASHAQTDLTPTLISILLEQLRTTHNVKDWFVPANTAIAGLTAEQANWKDNSENHSIAMLTTHLIFWNKQSRV